MGTNYYLHTPTQVLHIGKSSGGWCFSLHVTDKIKSLEDWKYQFKGFFNTIKDEYDSIFTPNEMIRIITERSWSDTRKNMIIEGKTWKQILIEENAVDEGPNNLMRRKVDGVHCIGHGEGTWDYIIGDF